jgi:hypothetical protein
VLGLFLQLGKILGNRNYVRQLKNEVNWINKFRELGIKTPKYFKVVSMIGKDNQEHHALKPSILFILNCCELGSED